MFLSFFFFLEKQFHYLIKYSTKLKDETLPRSNLISSDEIRIQWHVKESKRMIPMHVWAVWLIIVHAASYSTAYIAKHKQRHLVLFFMGYSFLIRRKASKTIQEENGKE